jgi:hypothetical protein
MGDNKCKNESEILRLAKSVINDTRTKDTNPIKDIFSYTFNESYSNAKEYYSKNYPSINSSSNSSIFAKISGIIVFAIIFIGFLIYNFIMAIWSYLENNLFYKIINIELFRTIDNHKHYYGKFILLSDGLIDLKKSKEEGGIKNIIDNRIEKILQDRLNSYLKDIGKIDKEYIEDRERIGRQKKEDREFQQRQNIADENNIQSSNNANATANGEVASRTISASIRAGAKGVAGLAVFFKNWSDTFTGFVIVTLCIILIILVIFEIYAPSEIIDKRISEKIDEKRKEYKKYSDNTLFASLSRIPEQFQLLFDEIQYLYQSFVKRVVFFKDFSSEFISDARNYSLYPIELSREDAANGGIYDNIYTFDYEFIKGIGDNTVNSKYSKGSQGNAILLIKPMDLKDHAKEIYGQTADLSNLSKLNTSLDLEQDGSNYKYKIKCTGTDADKNIFSSNCTIADIEGICGPEKQEGEDDYSKIQ